MLAIAPQSGAQNDKTKKPARNRGIVALAASPAVHQELELMEGQIGVLAKAVAGTRQQIQESKRVTDQFERRQTYSVATKGLRDTLLNEEQQKKWEHPKGKPLTPPAGKPQQKAKPT